MQLWVNNWSSALAAALSSAATSASIDPAAAAQLVGLGTGDYYRLTLVGRDQSGAELSREIVLATAAAGGILTITRAQEGTAAADWPIGTGIEARITAAAMLAANPTAAIAGHEAAQDPHPQYATAEEAANAAPVQSVNNRTGAVEIAEVPAGGATGQVLTKLSAASGDAGWQTPAAGGGGSGAAGDWAARTPDGVLMPGVVSLASTGISTATANRMFVWPFRVGEEVQVTQFLQQLDDFQTADLYIGIYANDATTDPLRDLPGALITGGISPAPGTSTYAAKWPAVADGVVRATLQPGVTYWLAVGFSASQPIKSQSLGAISPTLGYNVLGNGSLCPYMYVDMAPISLPANMSGVTLLRQTIANAARPIVGLIRP